ncbi:MAG: radical SAM family heme chaperone HemW [Candidatus Cloacimonetes bacterium]|nr:radical SAM family heme chaperone HemW [Candidatus Cloacimonadota bacterium]
MKEISIYIHIPFCLQKCSYCNFYSIAYDTQIVEKYMRGLIKEIGKFKGNDYIVKSVYFGGGTPSLLSFFQLFPIISKIAHTFHIDKNAEITLEANPSTINRIKAQDWKTLGINRISIGAQSFHDNELKLLGRIHSAEEIEQAVECVAEYCTLNYSLDLMYGIPGQTCDSWRKSILRAIELHPMHISSYCLSVEKNTPLYNIKDQLPFPDEDSQRDMYYSMISFLESHNIQQYEISNFALRGYESQHNTSYWMGKEYVGFGASAHSYYNMTRYANISDVNRYIHSIQNELPIVKSKKEIPTREYISDLIFLGLRMRRGISLSSIKTRYGFDLEKEYKHTIETYSKLGYLTIVDDHLKLTRKALFVSDEILREFV